MFILSYKYCCYCIIADHSRFWKNILYIDTSDNHCTHVKYDDGQQNIIVQFKTI